MPASGTLCPDRDLGHEGARSVEAVTTSAGAARVGIVDGEARADQLIGKVDGGAGQKGQRDRIDHHHLAAALQQLADNATGSASVYVCGSNAFVESVIAMLRALRIPDGAIRTERFGG